MKITMEENLNNIESKIDTSRFGIKVAKTDGSVFKTVSMGDLRKKGYKLIIARVDINSTDLINQMEDMGFRLKDLQTTYKHNLKNVNRFYTKLNKKNDDDFLVVIRDFKKEDTEILISIVKASFNDYGHYFRNSRLDKNKCLEVYEDWGYRTLTVKNIADKVIVACYKENPVGFLSFKICDLNGERYSAGGMGAVSSMQRGKSIFPKILHAGLKWSIDRRMDWCEHNVMVNNIPVNNSMIKAGFKPSNPVVTMHCWVD